MCISEGENCLPLVYLLEAYGNLVQDRIVVNQISSSRSSRKSWTPSASRAACLLHGWRPHTPAACRCEDEPSTQALRPLRLAPAAAHASRAMRRENARRMDGAGVCRLGFSAVNEAPRLECWRTDWKIGPLPRSRQESSDCACDSAQRRDF